MLCLNVDLDTVLVMARSGAAAAESLRVSTGRWKAPDLRQLRLQALMRILVIELHIPLHARDSSKAASEKV